MKTFEDYQLQNTEKVTALVLIDILNTLERVEKGLADVLRNSRSGALPLPQAATGYGKHDNHKQRR